MSIDKKKIGKILKVSAIGTGVTFLRLNMQKKKKGVLSLRKKNLFDKEKVVFVEDENDEENTDGVREPLEAIGKVKREG